MKRLSILNAIFVIPAILIGTSSYAGLITGATAITANTIGTLNGSELNMINQSGLSAGYLSGVTDFDTYIATAPTHPTNDPGNAWAGLDSPTGPVFGYIDFDLGATHEVETFALWTQSNDRAINDFKIYVDGVLGGTFNGVIGNAPDISVQTFDLLNGLVGGSVRLEVLSNHGGPNVNIGEVAFETAAVPEPSILFLMGMGLAGLGFTYRRKLQA
ncbi:PEP-CTERM sorting domain-containing protein [Nitrosomonas marina]|uniref:PEP-CTERM protein-sorting domain-containing protein n=1 Tax=Nitrosomonas marina TaxID=917 RepID=A0A1H8AA64_9PROT|nr:PEP-CTERM sorting domain-containing protein [Nitrosomonas marina]SEM67600.1 PEP-CTERM protein-sorting domain-containing protein [Nitrosomonas marina]